MDNMTKLQSRQLDLILKALIDSKGQVYNLENIQETILPEESIDNIRLLFYELNDHYPQLLHPISGATEDGFWANDYASSFLSNGGYSAWFDKMYAAQEKDSARKDLEDEKLKIDVKNAKRIFKTYWWTFGIALGALVISLINILWNIFGSK
jgi:hypothetical protein